MQSQDRHDTSYVGLESPRSPDKPKEEEAKAPKNSNAVSFLQLFSFADKTDMLLMAVGTIGAMVTGAAIPLQILFLGDMTKTFEPVDPRTKSHLQSDVGTVSLKFAVLGVIIVFTGFLQVSCWAMTSSRQTKRIRGAYIDSILKQEIGWFDTNEPGELVARLSEATVTLGNGMGSKVGHAICFTTFTITGFILGFIKGWELTLVLIAFTPIILILGYFANKAISKASQDSIDAYGKAGAIAQESLGNPRTIHAFNAIDHFDTKYSTALEGSYRAGVKKALTTGWGTGVLFFVFFCSYGIGLYYGAVKVAGDYLDDNDCQGSGCYDGSKVLIVAFSITEGALALSMTAPYLQAIDAARTAAYSIFQVIHRQSKIDPNTDDGLTMDKVQGNLDISDITFAYPSRPHVNVCEGYSLSIKAGETVALVGPSGSGKSTVVSLVERFYDPSSGSVCLDGQDIRQLNVKWLRKQVGLVGQEPSLFATTIMENIRYGAPEASDEDVREAAKMSNAYDFIMTFPQGFDTEVGERGAQLSGGQKQRIAIARAIIKNPPILLLDEATSALDTESERIVQESLDKLVKTTKRTTIIVAHRLSTIRDADKIAVHSNGSIVELGSHEELMQIKDGHYRQLVLSNASPTSGEEHNCHESDDMPQASSSKVHRVTSQVSNREDEVYTSSPDVTKHQEDVQSDGTESKASFMRVFKMSLPYWKHLTLGLIASVVKASIFPLWGLCFVKIIIVILTYRSAFDMKLEAGLWGIGFGILGLFYALSNTLQEYGFGVVANKLTVHVRRTTFQSMLQQDIGWFDQTENASGILVSRLSSDSALMHAAATGVLNLALVNITSMGIGYAISFAYSWRLTLVGLAISPFMFLGSYLEGKVMGDEINKDGAKSEDTTAGALFSQAVGSIRTVTSFGMGNALRQAYADRLATSNKKKARNGLMKGAAFGFAESVLFFQMSIMFYVGSGWVEDGYNTFEDILVVVIILMMIGITISVSIETASDTHQAREAAARVFQIIDRVPAIDATDSHGQKPQSVRGAIRMQHLQFTYPSRPDAKVYKNYSLNIQPGQTVALVGASGSGKSTAIGMLERFYDPDAGVITYDGIDIKKLNVPWLRDHISLVSQEPVLFSGTIAENIALGKPDVTREEVIDAAKKSNAHDFICNFPDGYDTDVGDNGAQVSGGQKQRIAIARAIVRDPEVLLLDEATSALDNESERIVQASLDNLLALKRRTTIIVAHRLSTIRNADLIAVTKDGAIVEQGTHDELMQIQDGAYKALIARQMSG